MKKAILAVVLIGIAAFVFPVLLPIGDDPADILGRLLVYGTVGVVLVAGIFGGLGFWLGSAKE